MSEPTQTNRKKSRRRNGDGNTYRHKNGWRTVISHKGHTVTAMGRSEQESRRLAKEKIKALPLYDGSLVPAAAKLTTGEYLTNWINKKHKTITVQPLIWPFLQGEKFWGADITFVIAIFKAFKNLIWTVCHGTLPFS